MPGWFGAVDVPKLKSAVERARATGVDAADVDAAERELSKAATAADAAAQMVVAGKEKASKDVAKDEVHYCSNCGNRLGANGGISPLS